MLRENDKLIDGVEINELKHFVDDRGAVMRMMRRDDPFFKMFGEVYFSIVRSGAVKAWHLHKSMTLNYACIFGQITLVIYDAREKSPTYGTFNTIHLEGYPTFRAYSLVKIPSGVWNGFRVVEWTTGTMNVSIIANCATEIHDPEEIVRIAPANFPVHYDWGPYEVAG